MASALRRLLLASAFTLAGPVAFAGSAPAAYYPSLGYGQTPPLYEGPPAYDKSPATAGAPARFDPREGYGPPPGYVGDPAYRNPPPTVGAPAYGAAEDWPPPQAYRRSDEGGYTGSSSSYSSRSYGAYSSRSVEQYGYDSGWRGEGSEFLGRGLRAGRLRPWLSLGRRRRRARLLRLQRPGIRLQLRLARRLSRGATAVPVRPSGRRGHAPVLGPSGVSGASLAPPFADRAPAQLLLRGRRRRRPRLHRRRLWRRRIRH